MKIEGRIWGSMPNWLRERLQSNGSADHSMVSLLSMGRLSQVMVLILMLSGVLLAFSFHPATADEAQQGITTLQGAPAYLQISRIVHRWSALLLLLATIAHMLQIWRVRAFRYPRDLNWSLGLILLVVTILLGSSGFLLRWDVKAVTLANLNVTQRTGALGFDAFLTKLVFPGESLQVVAVDRIYFAHILILPLLLFIGIGVHLWIAQRQRQRSAETTAAQSPRHQSINRRGWLLALILGATTIALLSRLPLEPLAPEPHTGSPWPHPDWLWLAYLIPVWLSANLVGGLGTILIPVGILLFLLAVPWLDSYKSQSKLSVALLTVGAALFVLIMSQTATLARRVPYQGCVACHRATMVGRAPVTPAALDSYNPDWLLFHLRSPVESILTPAQ